MSKSILISIHPEHVKNIISSKKVFEYRKYVPKDEVERLVIYVTSPIKKIVAVAEVLNILSASPSSLWKQTDKGGAINRTFFNDYFKNRKMARAFSLGKITELKAPLELSHIDNVTPPQSFRYLSDNEYMQIAKHLKKRPAFQNKLIFIGGVHGVGKSSLADKMISPFGFTNISASSIIKEEGAFLEILKRVESPDENQKLLLKGLAKHQKYKPRILLDGHFTLLNTKNEVTKIDINVFNSIKPNAIILKSASVDSVYDRLLKRDRVVWDKKLILSFQNMEYEHAHHIAHQLNVPFLQIKDNARSKDIFNKIESLISEI